MSRVVKLRVQTQDMPVVVNTNARTLGDLKQEPDVKKLGIDWKNVTLIEKASRNSLPLDESVLPATDCIIFVSPVKTKSGVDYNDMSTSELKKEVKDGRDDETIKYTGDLRRLTRKEAIKLLKKRDKKASKAMASESAGPVREVSAGTVTIAVKGVAPGNVLVVDYPEGEELPEHDVVEIVTSRSLTDEFNEITKKLNN